MLCIYNIYEELIPCYTLIIQYWSLNIFFLKRFTFYHILKLMVFTNKTVKIKALNIKNAFYILNIYIFLFHFTYIYVVRLKLSKIFSSFNLFCKGFVKDSDYN